MMDLFKKCYISPLYLYCARLDISSMKIILVMFADNSHFTFSDSRKKRKGEERPLVSKIKFDELLQHFLTVQAKHRDAKRKKLAFSISAFKNLDLK